MQKMYKVGGCVRDQLQGLNPKDVDWVVVGSTHEEMIDQGFSQVGADFPVYLHPKTGEEYALARTERKSGKGYHGFEVTIENVTLEDDLRRRDLTINAMALAGDYIIDPFNGQKDLEAKVLRHVDAEGFKEDPVRVLRIARFLARWTDFSVAKETMTLCKEMVANGELEHLTPERVTAEMMKALSEKRPSRFFYFLQMVGALKVVLPEIHALVGVEQPYEHHPEGDAFIHTMMVLDAASGDNDPLPAFCALVHDLGKGVTPREKWPHHFGHEAAGYWIVLKMAERLKISNEFRDHGALVSKYHMHIHKFHELNPKTIVAMSEDMKMRSNKHIAYLLPEISYCDSIGRTSFYEDRHYPNARVAEIMFHRLNQVKLSDLVDPKEIPSLTVNKIKDIIYRAKIAVVRETRKEFYE